MFQIECSNDQIGFGRKRRAIDVSNTDKNKLFEVTMSALIKVDFEEDAVVDKGKSDDAFFPCTTRIVSSRFLIDTLCSTALSELYIRRGKNRTKARAVIAEEVREQPAPTTIRTEERAFIAHEVKEQFKYKVSQTETNGSACRTSHLSYVLVLLCLCKLL